MIDPKTESLIQTALSLDFIVTNNEVEACLGKSEKD
jgi:hypothetical protein